MDPMGYRHLTPTGVTHLGRSAGTGPGFVRIGGGESIFKKAWHSEHFDINFRNAHSEKQIVGCTSFCSCQPLSWRPQTERSTDRR